jgi:hypothetical protein
MPFTTILRNMVVWVSHHWCELEREADKWYIRGAELIILF